MHITNKTISLDFTKTANLRNKLQSLADETVKDEEDIQDPSILHSLRVSRDLIQSLIRGLDKTLSEQKR